MVDDTEKLGVALQALRKIATFGHADECVSSAPLHECTCWWGKDDEREIARKALIELGEEVED